MSQNKNLLSFAALIMGFNLVACGNQTGSPEPSSTYTPSSTKNVGQLKGGIYGASRNDNGDVSVKGWACIVGSRNPVELTLHISGSGSESNIEIGTTFADKTSLNSNSICQNDTTSQDFEFLISNSQAEEFVGKSIFVFGKNPLAQTSEILSNSGTFYVPSKAFEDKGGPTGLPCSLDGQSAAHGGSIKAFQQSTVPFGSVCVSEMRQCVNGTLTGTFTSSTCKVDPAPPADIGSVVGNFEALTINSNGTAILRGWACVEKYNTSIRIHIYGVAPAGGSGAKFLADSLAGEVREQAVGTVCKNNITAHGFTVMLSKDQVDTYRNQKIYVHGLHPDPTGAKNIVINGSGIQLK